MSWEIPGKTVTESARCSGALQILFVIFLRILLYIYQSSLLLTTTLLFVLLYLTFINVTWMFEDYKLCPSKGILFLKTSNLCFRIQTLMENIYYWSFLLWSVQVICNIWMYNYVFNPAWEHAITYNGKLWGHETLGVLEHLISAEKKNTATKTF